MGITILAVAVAAGPVSAISRPPALSRPAAPDTGTAPLHDLAGIAGAPAPGAPTNRRSLVLYDDSGADWQAQQSNAIQTANLLSRTGYVTTRPLSAAQCDWSGYTAVVFIGTDDGKPEPRCLFDDVVHGKTPLLWMGPGIAQLFSAVPTASTTLGWSTTDGGSLMPVAVLYQGVRFTRQPQPDNPTVPIDLVAKSSKATVRAWAIMADGSRMPWAVTTGSFTYISEVPYNYVTYGDRYLVGADLIRSTALPDADMPDQHRALVRLEDVGPTADPVGLRAITDYLYSVHVPFTVAVYPVYVDVTGRYDDGKPTTLRLADRPKVVAALKYMEQHGGTLELHGYTHQYDHTLNPDGVSGADFEFYRVRKNTDGTVVNVGPVPEDSLAWAESRMQSGRAEMIRVGLPDPAIFEFPHYTASAVDYRAANDIFGVRYDEGSYFADSCRLGSVPCGSTPDPHSFFQQYFPFPVRDAYGSVVIPEDLGYLAPTVVGDTSTETAADIVSYARQMLVIRGGVASFFFHPYLGVDQLKPIVAGIQQAGFTFVAPTPLAERG